MAWDDLDRPDERWQRSRNPYTLVKLLKQRGVEGKRKFRLAAVACCRRVWVKLNAEQRQALEVIERYADGEAKYEEMRIAVSGLRIPKNRMQPHVVEAARRDAEPGRRGVLWDLLGVMWGRSENDIEEANTEPHGRYWKEAAVWQRECDMLCHIIRDSFAHVFRPVSLDPSWLTTTALDLAEAAYQHRDPSAGTLEPIRLAVLADALQDAGCDNATLLNHLREPGPHVLGCWAIDWVLDKKP